MDEEKEKKRPLVLADTPTCEMLDQSIKDERNAVYSYLEEATRTDDDVLKRFFHDIAVDEMNHLDQLKSINDKVCVVKKQE